MASESVSDLRSAIAELKRDLIRQNLATLTALTLACAAIARFC